MQIQQARAHIMATLASGNPRADADALLCHLLECRRGYLMTWPERELDAAQQATLAGWLAPPPQGEPIAHLIGEREFWSLPLKVSPATLIPRPGYRGAGGAGAGAFLPAGPLRPAGSRHRDRRHRARAQVRATGCRCMGRGQDAGGRRPGLHQQRRAGLARRRCGTAAGSSRSRVLRALR